MATKHFYYICLIGITLLGGSFLLLLKHRFKSTSEGKGITLVAFGMFSFATIGLYKLFDPPFPVLLLSDIDRIFSVFTNIFFVAAFPFFPNVFSKFRNTFSIYRNTDRWVISVFIFFAFLAALFAVLERNIQSEVGKNIIIAIDSFFSTTTIGLITYIIYKSFTALLHDKISKIFIGTFLLLFPISQIILPLTVIFPDQLNYLYFTFLIVLLVGIAFFNFTTIAYYSISNLEISQNKIEDTSEPKKDELQIIFLNLGFDSLKKVYFIEIDFIKENVKFKERIENRKILLPFSNWILFAIAKKINVKILNQDIALRKFRMVEYWNKVSDTKIDQDVLFVNDIGSFEFNFDADAIEITNLNHLESKLIIIETIQKDIENFTSLFLAKGKSKLEAKEVFNLIRDEEKW